MGRAIALDATSVYWTTRGGIAKVGKSGFGRTILAATAETASLDDLSGATGSGSPSTARTSNWAEKVASLTTTGTLKTGSDRRRNGDAAGLRFEESEGGRRGRYERVLDRIWRLLRPAENREVTHPLRSRLHHRARPECAADLSHRDACDDGPPPAEPHKASGRAYRPSR